MTANNLIKLESNIAFKKDYLNKTGWWKNARIIPPFIFLFLGLFGLIYLMKVNMLISLYAIPFVLVFAIATIWLKTIKKYIVTTQTSAPGSYIVCMAKAVEADDKYAYVVFMADAKRHYEHNITKFAKELLLSLQPDIKQQATKKVVRLHDETSGADFNLKALKLKDIYKEHKGWDENQCIPVIFIDLEHTYVVKKKYLD